MMGLIFSTMLKKYFRRPRPILTKTHRIKDVRGKEIDSSWPSGDTTQGGIFCFYMLHNMPDVV